MHDPTRYRIPAAVHWAELSVSRSRFRCSLAHAATSQDARAFIAEIESAWPDCNHHATAWVAGPPGSTADIGLSDAGEPHGTAGRPMLNVLLHCGVGEIVAVVSRWFGGVKLGTGGLARAYADSVGLALETLATTERMATVRLELTIGYNQVRAVQHLLPTFEAAVESETYEALVLFRIRLPALREAALRTALADATQGTAIVVACDD